MNRITLKDLEAVRDRINRITNSPMTYHDKNAATFKSNIGHYTLDNAYGGWSLQRVSNEHGGVETIIHGYRPKAELYELMQAFIKGLESRQ